MRNTGKGMQGRGAVTELLQGLPVPALAPPAGDQTLLLSFVAIRFVRGSRVRRRLHIAVSGAALVGKKETFCNETGVSRHDGVRDLLPLLDDAAGCPQEYTKSINKLDKLTRPGITAGRARPGPPRWLRT